MYPREAYIPSGYSAVYVGTGTLRRRGLMEGLIDGPAALTPAGPSWLQPRLALAGLVVASSGDDDTPGAPARRLASNGPHASQEKPTMDWQAAQGMFTYLDSVQATLVAAASTLPLQLVAWPEHYVYFGAYLRPTYASTFLGAGFGSGLAGELRSFVERGGVVLVTASTHVDVARGQVCESPLALLGALLGAAAAGCACEPPDSLPVGTYPVGRIDGDAAQSVWGSDVAGGLLRSSAGHELVLPTVGVMPVRCPAGSLARRVMPVFLRSPSGLTDAGSGAVLAWRLGGGW
eukprot:161838-Chlamydomonas_euryale.AAC.1